MFPSKEDIKKRLDEYVVQKDEHVLCSKFLRKQRTDFAGLSICSIIHSPPMWYYLMNNNVKSIPKNCQLRKTCDELSCISHYVLCSKRWSKRTDKGGYTIQFTPGDYELIKKRLDEGSELNDYDNIFMKSPCREWKKFIHHGYGVMQYNSRNFRTHILSYLCKTKTNTIPDNKVVRHLCGNSKCLRQDHLEIGTFIENSNDAKLHGTVKMGVNTPQSIIKDETIVSEICNLKCIMTQHERSKKFNVSRSVISRIDAGIAYNSVTNYKKTRHVSQRIPISQSDFEHVRQLIKNNIKYENDHWIWTSFIRKDHYGSCTFKRISYPAHRLSYMVFNNQIPENTKNLVVRHKCAIKTCVNPDHLELGTSKQNAKDRQRDGTQKSPNAKITQEIADKIRESKECGTKRQRAELFGTTISTVSAIDQGRSWKRQK